MLAEESLGPPMNPPKEEPRVAPVRLEFGMTFAELEKWFGSCNGVIESRPYLRDRENPIRFQCRIEKANWLLIQGAWQTTIHLAMLRCYELFQSSWVTPRVENPK